MAAVQNLLTEARARIAVEDVELAEARRRRQLVADADIPLGAAYPRDEAEQERQRCLVVMRQHLGSTPSPPEQPKEGTP